MDNITPQDLSRIDLAHSIWAASFAGAFVAMCALPFVYGGRWLFALIGG